MIRKDLLSKAFVLSLIISLNGVLITACGSRDSVESIATIEESTEIESSTTNESIEMEESVIEKSSEIESEIDDEKTSEIEAETEEVSLEENTSEATTEVEVLEAEPYIMYVASNCNVRREADKKSELIMTLAKGVEITCYGTEGDWTQIDCQGIVAYIHTSLLTPTKPASSSTSSTGSSSQSGSTQSSGGTSQQTQTISQSTTPTQSSQTASPTQPYTPVENADGTITVYDDWGGKLTLRPTGDGYYVDQYGAKRSKEGYDINPITGQPMKPNYDTIEYQGGVGASYNSGLTSN